MNKVDEIHWGRGSAFNMGRIPECDVRIERVKDQNKKFYFLLSDASLTYLYCDSERYDTLKEMENAVFDWLRMKGRL